MNWIVIEGIADFDGRYEFDAERDFTTREWGWIKRLSGYLPLTIDKGFDGGDPELYASFACIALHRTGKVDSREVPAVFERIIDAPFGSSITLEGDKTKEDEPTSPPPSSSNGSGATSGDDSTRSSAPLAIPLPPIGTPASATSPSPPQRSGT